MLLRRSIACLFLALSPVAFAAGCGEVDPVATEKGDAGSEHDAGWRKDSGLRPDSGSNRQRVDGGTSGFCQGRPAGGFCDGEEIVICAEGKEKFRDGCMMGCMPGANPGEAECKGSSMMSFCTGRSDGMYCNGDKLVTCTAEKASMSKTCQYGCSEPQAGMAECKSKPATPMCPMTPASKSSNPTTQQCNYMDWGLSPDGFYLFSQFGMDLDMSTWGNASTCGTMQTEYSNRGCQYSYETMSCISQDTMIPWIQGDVDYKVDTALPRVRKHKGGDVPYPEYFYVAGAQRFGCGALLRVSDPKTGKCVVAYAEDGGPNSTYEMSAEGGRRILDSSPAVLEYLDLRDDCCWGTGNLVYVEWAKSGDKPGQNCTPCTSTPAKAGTESKRTQWDVDALFSTDCH